MKSTKKQLRANPSLIKSDFHYRQLFDTIREGILVVESSTDTVSDANPFFLSMIGYFRSEIVGAKLSDLGIFQSDGDPETSLVNLHPDIQYSSITTKEGTKIETEVFMSELDELDTKYFVYCFRNVTALVHKNQELTDRIKTLTQLSEFQEKTNEVILNITEDLEIAKELLNTEKSKADAILASIADAVVACDTDGKILQFNKSAEDLTGIASKSAIGFDYKKIIKVFNGKTGQVCKNLIDITLNHKDRNNLFSTISPNGTRTFLSISTAKIIRDSNHPIGYVVVFHDISREQEIDKAKSEFVSIASHQLRTPLTTINWATENLISGNLGILEPQQLDQVNEVHSASKRMVMLVDAFLNVSRLEMGTITIEPEKVNVTEAVKRSLRELEPKILDKKLIIQEVYGTGTSTFNTDPKLLNVILINLLSNASKYTPSGGKITISIHKHNSNFQIIVTDTGIGIPENQQKMVFSKLFRADNAQKIDSSGTGIGLYIVREIVLSLNGKISFVSKSGEGSAFTVTLPLTTIKQNPSTKKLLFTARL